MLFTGDWGQISCVSATSGFALAHAPASLPRATYKQRQARACARRPSSAARESKTPS